MLVLFHPYMRIFYSTIVLSTLITWFIFSNTILHIYILYILYIYYIYILEVALEVAHDTECSNATEIQ